MYIITFVHYELYYYYIFSLIFWYQAIPVLKIKLGFLEFYLSLTYSGFPSGSRGLYNCSQLEPQASRWTTHI